MSMKRMKKMVALAVTAAMTTGIFGVGVEAKADSDEQITLRFNWWGSDGRHEATLACIEAFEKANPNIKIEAEYGGYDGYQDKVSAALSGGTEADILQLDTPWLSTFTSQNPDLFLDVRDYTDIVNLDNFSEDFLNDFCVYNDKLVGLPTGIAAFVFLANKTILEEAGIEFSDVITLDDIYEQGKKINAANPDNYFLNMDSGTFYFVTRTYLRQMNDGQLINDDYTVGVTVDELEEAFEYTKKLYDDKVVIPYEESMVFKGSCSDNPKWDNNQLASWLSWSSMVDQQNWGDDAIVLPYPCLEGAENSGIVVRPSQVVAVSANCEHPEEAMKFLDFMFKQDEGILILKDCRSVPANDYARELLQENGLISDQASQSVSLALENPGTPELDVPNTTEVTTAFETVMERLIYGQYESCREAAEDAYNQMTTILETIKADME